MKKYLNKKLIKQLFIFGIVGVVAFLIDFGIYKFLTIVFDMNYLLANFIGFAVSVIANYIASIKWVFEVKRKQDKKAFIIFVILSAVGLGINELVMYIGVGRLSWNDTLVKLAATAIVMVYNFITRKIFLEKE